VVNAAWVGWALAVVALAAGYGAYGWRGVLLAVSVVVFWLLLQFSRSLRALRLASRRPVGALNSAVMLQAQLHKGMRLPEVLRLTHSLGRKLADDPETFAWIDGGGDAVHIELRDGRVTHWQLHRAAEAAGA
jgi:uncharacterized protein (DUF58 family)